jgi:multiple sugar transport system substrate-binding protein
MINRMARDLAQSKARLDEVATRPVSRRSFIAAGGALAGGLVLAGCGGSGSSSGSTTKASTGAAAKPATLVFWTIDSFTSEKDNALAKAAKQYAADNPGTKVEIQSFSPGVYKDKLIAAIQGGKGPDVAAIDSAWVAELSSAKALVDLTERYQPLASQYFEGAAATGTFEQQQYAVPWYTNNVALYYNKDLFAKAGLKQAPQTWDELSGFGKELTGGKQYGMMLGSNWYGPFLWWPFLWQNGGEIASPDGKTATFASAQGQEAWQFYADLYLKDKIVPETFLGVNGDWDQYFKPFTQGRVAMMMTGDWGLYGVDAAAPNLNYGVAPLPRQKQAATVVGGYDLAIPRTSGNQDAAWKLVAWLTGKEQESTLAAYQRVPARKDVLDVASFTKGKPGVFTQQAAVAKTRPVVPKWSQVEGSAMADAWDATIHRKQSPSDALKAAQEQATSALSA